MKTLIAINLLLIGSLSADFDLNSIRQIQEQLEQSFVKKYPDIEQKNDLELKEMLTETVESVFKELPDKEWRYPGDLAWPIVDWEKVDGVGEFFEKQSQMFERWGVIASTNQEAAQIAYLAELLAHFSDSGDHWFIEWMFDVVQSDERNKKLMLYFSIDSFAGDAFRDNPAKIIRVDWLRFAETFHKSDRLGKAILLKGMTQLAKVTDNFETARRIHLSIFKGEDDDLKAIALVRGSRGFGEEVYEQWENISNSAVNTKLKNLAQQILEQESIEMK